MNNVRLLAFGFASPGLLAWLALAAVPVLIHWLFRRRYRETAWAAMQFLHEAARKQSRRMRLEQLLLLAARVLILVALVLALARPRWADARNAARTTPPTLRLLVIDCSLSMGRHAADDAASRHTTEQRPADQRTLFDIAKQTAKDLVQRSAAGDRFLLLRVAGTQPRILIRQPTLVANAVLDEIDRLPLTFERGDVLATLQQLPGLLDLKRPHERCEVSIISDFQADNWSPAIEGNERRKAWERVATDALLVLIDVGTVKPDNATLLSLTSNPPILAADQPMTVAVTARNTGSVPLAGRQLQLFIDEQLIESTRIDLPLGQTVTTEFTLTAPASGEHVLRARLEDDALPVDNQRWLPLSVRSDLNVLLVNGRPAGRPRESATFFVEQALAPHGHSRATPQDSDALQRLRVDTVAEAELAQTEFTRFDVVFLCDVGVLTEADVERLRRFVESGGGLIVSLGPSVAMDRANEFAFGPRGLMSVQLQDVISASAAEGPPTIFAFDPGEFTHPLLREFRGNPGAGLETALIRQYVRTVVPTSSTIQHLSSVEVALNFSSGDPAILTQARGTGRSVLITTSVDESWGAWAVWAPGFVPLMHELVLYAAAGRIQPRDELVGESILSLLRGSGSDAAVTLTLPNGEQQRVTIADIDDLPTVVVRDTARPGVYVLSSESPPLAEQFAINVDSRESDPLRFTRQELAPPSSPTQVAFRDVTDPAPKTELAENASAAELSRGLLVTLFLLLLVEQCLAWRFARGASLAVLLAALAAVWLGTSSVLAIVVAAGILAVVAFGAPIALTRGKR